jgi:antitoxin component YwqK of YwqJK toxin-antitoxin module
MKTHTTRKFLVSLAAASLCLSACGDKALDFRNAELNNGAIYARGENSPFTGNVTNVPDAVVFNDPGFMAFGNAAGKAYGTAMQQANPQITRNLDEFVRQSANLLVSTGLLLTNGDGVVCNIKVSDGRLTGKVTCMQPGTDNVALEANMGDHGSFDGPVAAYIYDGGKQSPFVTATFRDGKRDGQESIYSPSTHRLIYSASFDGGIQTGTEDVFDGNTGNRLQEATYVDGKPDGGFTRWAPGGNQVIDKGTYSNGALDGIEEGFDPDTGKRTAEAHWLNGKLNGENRKWDAQGNLIALRTYQNGFLATTSDAQETRFAYGQDPNHPAVYVPLQAASVAVAASDNNQPAQTTVPASAPGTTQSDQPVQPANTTGASGPSSDEATVRRCGWIENNLPSRLTLKDRDGTWDMTDARGIESAPALEKGDSCGCLNVVSDKPSMRILKVTGGRLSPISACQKDKSLN